jgi:predicted outer membrane protein
MRTIIAAAVIAALAATGAAAQQRTSLQTLIFAKNAGGANTFEIQSSQLAGTRARSPGV